MSEIKKVFYNPEKDLKEIYTEQWIIEKSRVKDIEDLLVRHHYWKDSDGELWTDFLNPMENVKADFNAYRTRRKFMSPEELRELRSDLKLTVREFSKLTGLGSSNISQIENNQRVQTKYQDMMFQLIRAQYKATGEIRTNEAKYDNATDAFNDEITNAQPFDPNLYSQSNHKATYSYDLDKTLGDAA